MFDGYLFLIMIVLVLGTILGIGAIVIATAYLLERSLKMARRMAGRN